jgi:hypothetical protein
MKSFLLTPKKLEQLTRYFEISIKMEFWRKFMIDKRKNKLKNKLNLSQMEILTLQWMEVILSKMKSMLWSQNS